MKKNKVHGSTIVITFVVLFILMAVILIGWVLYSSVQRREFDNCMWVLVNESNICAAESDDGKVIVTEPNLSALYTQYQLASRKVVLGNPKALDSVVFTFTCHKKEELLYIELVDDDTIRMRVDGEKRYCAYFRSEGRFETFRKIASPQGLQEPNREIGT